MMLVEAKLKQMFDPEAQFRQQIMGLISGGGQGGRPSIGQPPSQQPSLQDIFSQMPREQQPAMSLASGGMGDVQGRPIDLSALSRMQTQPQAQPQGQQLPSAGGFRPTGFSYGGFTFENPEEKLRMEVEKVKALKAARGQTPAEQWNGIRIQNEERTNKLKADAVKDSASETLKTIGEIKKKMGSFGLTGGLPSIPGTARMNWEVNINKLTSEMVLRTMNNLKQASRTGATGFGALSDRELGILQNAATSLKRTLSPEDAQRYIADIEESMNKILMEQTSEQPAMQSLGQPAQQGSGSFSYLWE